jgi:hypothetical protein
MSGAKKVGPAAEHIVETEIDGEISLYNPTSDQVMVLNRTATDIWLLSDGEHTLAEMTALLALAYGVEAGEISDDVEKAVADFEENGFLNNGAIG